MRPKQYFENRVHENLLKHCEPYLKIPWPEIVETIGKIAKGEVDGKDVA